MKVVGFRPRSITWMLSLTPAQLQHEGTLNSSPEAHLNWEPGVCWTWPCAEHSVLRPSPGQLPSSCCASVPCQQLGSPPHSLRQNWSEAWITTTLHILLLLERHEAGNYTQPTESRWKRVSHLSWGTEGSKDKASRRRSPVLAQRLAMLPWASVLKTFMIQQQAPDLQRCELELCASGHFMLCSNIPLDMGNCGN